VRTATPWRDSNLPVPCATNRQANPGLHPVGATFGVQRMRVAMRLAYTRPS